MNSIKIHHLFFITGYNLLFDNTEHRKLELLQSLGGLYDGLAFYALHWS